MERRCNALLRLRHLREQSQARGEDMNAMRSRFTTLAGRHENGTAPVAVSAFNLFQTPTAIASRMIDLAAIEPEHQVLEPSAGMGRLIDALQASAWGCTITAIEQNQNLCRHLWDKYQTITIRCADFLQEPGGTQFDRVVMNPPFKNGLDIQHIQHAIELLKPGGRLVALCANGPRQSAELRPLSHHWEALPAGSFRSEGTGVAVAMLAIER